MWYRRLSGAKKLTEQHQNSEKAVLTDAKHPAVKGLDPELSTSFSWEMYQLDEQSIPLVELNVDDSEDVIPLSWLGQTQGHSSLQESLPYDEAVWEEKFISAYLESALSSALENAMRDYAVAETMRVPEENRFLKEVLADDLFEPMELAVLPDGQVLVVQRRGGLFRYDPARERYDSIAHIPVYNGQEDGLLGIAVDPNYATNSWIYLFYSPPGKEAKQHLSRFVFREDVLDFESEKVVLVVPTQRAECCHSGGSLAFGPDGNLYLSTGDDTNPFASNGFNPIDERPGRAPWDAQRSSANANDLRGKILRIKPEADGTYSIPEGNLFPPGTPNTRPEIFVMGCRNPFRISIDSRNGYLYWGDVGPDAGKGEPERGPKGYDEINQARRAGFWGWPYTRGNNFAYRDYDFQKGESGPSFDPNRPINESPNNTGMRELPPAQPSLIWYSYDDSEDFPWTGKGGKNPMAGPVYYYDDFAGKHKFPEYFDGKLLIYEWMRHWIYVVKLDENGHFLRADPFMPNTGFSRPMDMAFAPDGTLYVLEYGPKWFAQNKEAKLSRIEFIKGNRPPIAKLKVEEEYGALPFEAQFTAAGSFDYDRADELSFEWYLNGNLLPEGSASLTHIFEEEGKHEVKVIVKDLSGEQSSKVQTIHAGNEAPSVQWKIAGNESFFWEDRTIDYEVVVTDKEDGKDIDPQRLEISFDHLPLGQDFTEIAQGHAAQLAKFSAAKGAALIEKSDCKVCHAADLKINGPSYLQIAQRYHGQTDVEEVLADRIISGGSGNWGETVMAAHPDLSKEDALAMVQYILTIETAQKGKQTRPREGTYKVEGTNDAGQLILWAAYTDKGHGAIDPVTVEDRKVLRPLKLEAEQCDEYSQGIYAADIEGEVYLQEFAHDGHFVFKNIDLTDLQTIEAKLYCRGAADGASLLVRLDRIDGPIAAQAALAPCRGKTDRTVTLALDEVEGRHDLYFVFINPDNANGRIADIDRLQFNLGRLEQ